MSISLSIRSQTAGVTFPLKISSNNRYLETAGGLPFLMTGDSPQALTVNSSPNIGDGNNVQQYLSARRDQGFNTLWVNLLCNDGTGGRSDGSTFDGITPFTTPGDFSTPRTTFFDRCVALIQLCSDYGFAVLLDPAELIGWLGTVNANGVTKCRNYGRYLGTKFNALKNIIWMSGNDYQTFSGSDDTVSAIALGIKDTMPDVLQTLELAYLCSLSTDDTDWVGTYNAPLDINAAYTYYPTYAEILNGYNLSSPIPVFMVEGSYEGEHNGGTPDEANGFLLHALRRQEYWPLTSGATGQVFGEHYTSFMRTGWQSHLTTPGALEMAYVVELFGSHRWYDLIPEPEVSTFITAGRGTYGNEATVGWSYVTAARTTDNKLAIIYCPSTSVITVDLTKMDGTVTTRWYDPTNGELSSATHSGTLSAAVFTTPSTNSTGDPDWILLIEAV